MKKKYTNNRNDQKSILMNSEGIEIGFGEVLRCIETPPSQYRITGYSAYQLGKTLTLSVCLIDCIFNLNKLNKY